ncbi:MAG: hypothetical protein IJ802_01130 [Kiritimatiellae bacterium]|nr:hypothetical protein [Kiritimatiellia bacterium]
MRNVAVPAAMVALALAGGVCMFVWESCRVSVPEGYMAIVTTKTGDELPEGAILAEPGQKGVQRIPLAEGRHFLNPVNNDWRIVPVTQIPAGSIGVVTSKTGKELSAGEILAADGDSKGVWKDVLGPGTYRLNPEGYTVDIRNAINIPIGYVGVVTSQTGRPARKGEFAKLGEKGVMENVLQPGLYYINPRAYQVDVVEIGMNQVSIVGRGGTVVLTKAQNTSVNGLADLQEETLNLQSAKRAEYIERNADLVQSTGKIAPLSSWGGAASRKAKTKKAEPARMDNVESALQSVIPAAQSDSAAFGMNQFVQFPSSDGFAIMLDMTVEFELMPENISRIFMLYGDLPAVVGKIILPQILSVSRIKGSGYKAREFIDGEGRQKFQREMTDELVRILGEKGILVKNAIVRHVEVPPDILAPIQATSIAKEQDLTNKTQQETAKKQAELNTETARVEQLKREVEQETLKLVATIGAQTEKAVRQIAAETQLEVAGINLETAKIQAQITETRGAAQVKAKFVVDNETALGAQRKAKVFKDPSTLADLKFAEELGDDLSIKVLHAGEGTLWTDLKSAGVAIPAK